MANTLYPNYLISRQPIFGPKINLAGYEVCTRPILESTTALSPSDVTRALFAMFTGSGLDHVVGADACFIPMTTEALAGGLWKQVANSRVVFEYLNDFEPSDEDARELLNMVDRGCGIVLSDRLRPQSLDLLGNRAHAIRFDVTSYRPTDLENRIRELKRYKSRLLAANVDTYDDLEFCKGLGFDFYQGRFVSRSAGQKKEVPVNRLTMMRILSKLQDRDLLMPDLEKAISQDVALSFKLLQYANSAAVALPRKVSSIGHAVRLIGVDTLRTWANVLLLSMVEDKPRELMTIALVRARMCQGLSESLKEAAAESFFSAGLLSVLDALLDCPMDQAVAELPLTDDVRDALVNQTGRIGQALRCTLAYERADWDEVEFYGLAPAPIRDIYMDAISWARQLSTGLLA